MVKSLLPQENGYVIKQIIFRECNLFTLMESSLWQKKKKKGNIPCTVQDSCIFQGNTHTHSLTAFWNNRLLNSFLRGRVVKRYGGKWQRKPIQHYRQMELNLKHWHNNNSTINYSDISNLIYPSHTSFVVISISIYTLCVKLQWFIIRNSGGSEELRQKYCFKSRNNSKKMPRNLQCITS
jgi:hypothetical protein